MDKPPSTTRDLVEYVTWRKPHKQPAVLTRHQGKVQGTLSSPARVQVHLDGDTSNTVNMRYFSFYSPTIGDKVEIIMDGSDGMVLGKLA